MASMIECYLSSVFAQELCARQPLPFKEVLESFEFFACVRNRIQSKSVADLCCGHGLVEILFAMFQRDVEHVCLLDKVRPQSFELVLRATFWAQTWPSMSTAHTAYMRRAIVYGGI